MKKTNFKITIFTIVIFLFLSSCSQSRKNELIYRFTVNENAITLDSLKSEILSSSGTEMLVVYPDSDVVIIHYDRFRTHQEIIESHFIESGYQVTLLKKTSLEEKDQPWKKK